MANYLTVRLTDDPSAVRFFQKLTLSLSFRAETERFSKIVGTFILSISNNSASVAAHIRRLIIDIGFAGMAFRAVTYLLIRSVAAVHCFAGMAFRAVTYLLIRSVAAVHCFAGMAFRAVTYHSLTGSMTLYGFCRYGVSSSYLPRMEGRDACCPFCRYGVSSSYLPCHH